MSQTHTAAPSGAPSHTSAPSGAPTRAHTPAPSDVLERFLRYVRIDTQSDPHNEAGVPSSECQHTLAHLLASELAELGCTDARADEHAYTTASFPASPGAENLPALGLIAHIDTSPDAPAAGVQPHIVHYTGGNLVAGVVHGRPVQTTPAELPDLDLLRGQDIVCSDGTTLLGADDKAGVAEIMALVARLAAQPDLPHPTLKLAFVPDEEIGHGAALLDLDAFGARWAYTVDGESLGEFNYECFYASQAHIVAHGKPYHPGTGKNLLVNAITVLREFDALIPEWERPEHTEGYEGFFHAIEVSGNSFEAVLTYIIRDFDAERFAARERLLRDVAAYLNERHGAETVEVAVRKQYHNMAEHLRGLDFLRTNALEAMEACGMDTRVVPVRGGTDGAQLTFRGLPCPNLPTGGYNYHGVREFIPVRSLEMMVDALQALVARFAVEQ